MKKLVKKKEINEDIEKQVIRCLNKINRATEEFHVSIRITALKRMLMDENQVIQTSYTFYNEDGDKKERFNRKPPKDDRMVF